MSEIDAYPHECIGIVNCPAPFEIVHGNNRHRLIALYRLEQDALDESGAWRAKTGDLLLGGGSGESSTLRISVPEAFYFFTHAGRAFDKPDEIYQAYWTMTEAYVFCEGYARLGWTPQRPIEEWLAEHILAYVVREYPDQYTQFMGDSPLNQDGSICRRPTAREKQGLLDLP